MTQAAAYDVVIGLEVHTQLASKTKIFCACPTQFGQAPNTQICPICTGMPGSLPVMNRRVFELALRAVLAFDGQVQRQIKFDRKNYFYPDLPKNYQISQYDQPIGKGGFVEIVTTSGAKRIRLTRIHLEEDAGKLIHDAVPGASLVDFNRSGVPLIEIVSEPDLQSPEEAFEYLVGLKAVLKAMGVSEVNMEMGHLRCDANISLRKDRQSPLGVKVEIKNLNSFKNVRLALEFEIKRQSELLTQGQTIAQETRLWDAVKGLTLSMRSKEEAHDYRYFPEPDLVPFEADAAWIEKVRSELPQHPKIKLENFSNRYQLSHYDATVLLQNEDLEYVFMESSQTHRYSNFKNLSNWLMGPVSAYLNEPGADIKFLKANTAGFVGLLKMVDEGKISHKVAKDDIFPEFVRTGKAPLDIVEAKGLSQISDTGAIKPLIAEALKNHPSVVADFRSGKANALMFLVGQVMRQSKGKANPQMVKDLLEKELSQ